jgi:hypothetical protein
MAVCDLSEMAIAAALLDRPKQLGCTTVESCPAQTRRQLFGGFQFNIQARWMPALIGAKRLEAKFPQQSDGLGIRCRASDHPTADLGRPGVQGLLKQSLLNHAMTVIINRAKQLRQLEDPAAATTVERPGNNAGHWAVTIKGQQATRRTTGEEIREALLH